MSMHSYTQTSSGEMVYIWRPDWDKIKLLCVTLLIIVVFFASLMVIVMTRYYAKADLTDRMDALGDTIQEYLFSDQETANIFPKEYRSIAIQMSQAKAKMQHHERLLKEESARRNDLITYLAHDLKTPLTSVIGYLSLLSEAPDMPLEQRARYTNIAFEKAKRLEYLINEFFDITRYNLQQIRFDIAPIDLTYMLIQMTDEFYPLARQHGNYITLESDDEMTIDGDANKLARVFNNILKNAITYSDPDTEIRVSAHQSSDQVTLRFTSIGPTIPANKLDMLFEKFFRLDESRSTRTGGAGLGLAIAREIVERHKGTIRAESQDQRTTFTIILPVKQTLRPVSTTTQQ